MASILVFLCFGVTQAKDGPFSRPHPGNLPFLSPCVPRIPSVLSSCYVCSAGCECPVLFCQLLWLLPSCQEELTVLPSICPMALSHSSCRPGCPRITGGARNLEVAIGCCLHHPFPSSDKFMHQIVPCEPQLEVISHPPFSSVGQSSTRRRLRLRLGVT